MINVLVVEDEPPIQRMICKTISEMDQEFRIAYTAFNGIQARQILETEKVDVVFTDIMMIGGDGITLLQYLHENRPEIQTVVLSGYDKFEYAKQAYKSGITDYLLKPVNKTELKDILEVLKKQYRLRMRERRQEEAMTEDGEEIMPQMVVMIEQYLMDNYKRNIKAGELSMEFGFVSEYISRIFKKYVGLTPSRYLTKIRMEKACELIRNNPEIQIKEVADQVGYKDIHYFSKVFRKEMGVWPSEYK